MVVLKRDLGGKLNLKAVLVAIRDVIVGLSTRLCRDVENVSHLRIRYYAKLAARKHIIIRPSFTGRYLEDIILLPQFVFIISVISTSIHIIN